jgi:hypothetical protein
MNTFDAGITVDVYSNGTQFDMVVSDFMATLAESSYATLQEATEAAQQHVKENPNHTYRGVTYITDDDLFVDMEAWYGSNI